jgi:hypothetical protein
MGIKSLIFSMLPKKMQHDRIIQKTGFFFMEKAYFTDSICTGLYMPPKQQAWKNRLSKPYGHEPEVVKWYERNLKSGDVVFDIGSHMGYFAVLVTKMNAEAKFHGFEANWFIASYFKMNQKLHDPQGSWKLTEKFVGKQDNAEMIAMDTYIRQNGQPTIFQMDVDGEEINVLSGAKALLAAGTTTFIVEVHPKDLAERGQSDKDFVALFSKDLYTLRYLPNLRSEATAWTDQITEAEAREEYYLCATPKSAPRI